MTANPRWGSSGAARNAGAAGAAGGETSRASSSDYPLSPSRRQEYLLPTIRFPVNAPPSSPVPSASGTTHATPSIPVPTIVVTPPPSLKRQRHKSSPSDTPLPDDDEVPLDAMETSASADPAASDPPTVNLSAPRDKRSKSDDEASVDSEVQEAARGLSGGESEDILPGARAPEEENPSS